MADQRYRVIDRLEAGGMAEVFRAEAVSVQGFKKQVAIKRVLPHLSQNRNFIAMFLDEARLGARLSHANIVSVFDIGAADNTYFIVMEFIDGGNLKSIMEELRKDGKTFPLKDALYICMEACRGLSYAHEITDENGQPLHIVHRDVSPPNIMLSRRGEIKLTDFGLAKASTQLEKTDPGVVKGKFSYLSPEAALGQPVDERADVFALGVVLWEMLSGKRLFLGDSDYQTVKLVQKADVPSLVGVHPEVDAEFEEILRKSLARDVKQRYASAREFGDALAGYLFGHKMKVTSYDIANMVKTTLKEGPKLKRADQSIIDRLIQEELAAFTSLDQMADPLTPGSAPIGPEELEGAMPLADLGFENPREWFGDERRAPADLTGMAGIELPAPTANREWRESGMDTGQAGIAHLLEEESHHGHAVSSGSRARPVAQPEPPKPAPAPEAKPAKKKKSKGNDGDGVFLYASVGFVVVLVLAAAAVYFLGLVKF